MKTVLIADDEPAIRALLTIFLEPRYRVVQATTGEEALTLAQAEAPDLAILDITMPKLTGLDVAARLHLDRATAGIPVVILSGWGTPEDSPTPIAAYLAKPFKRDDLLDTISVIFGETPRPPA